jgi:hypothetical protein
MKKILIGALFGLLIIPQITFAAWWNPFSWFRKAPVPAPIITPLAPAPLPTKTEEVKVEKKEESKSAPQQKKATITNPSASKPNTFSTDVNLWVEAINSRVVSYQKYSDMLESAVARDQANVKKLQSYPVDEYVYNFIFASSLNYKVQLEEITKKLDAKIIELNSALNTIKAKSEIDTAVWNPKLKDFDNYLLVSLNSVVENKIKHEADLAEANDYIKLLLSKSSSGSSSSYSQNSTTTQFNSEVNEYNNKLSDMKKQLVEEYTAAGGYWTASQLEANAMQRLKEMGIKPPTSPSGKLDIGSYSSTKCNSLNGGLDCYGSSGARTQVIPMGNGQFEIRGW